MRQITKDIQIKIDGNPVGFRLTKLDAFSGVTLMRLLMRLENQAEQGWNRARTADASVSRTAHEMDDYQRSANAEPENRPHRSAPTLFDLIASLSEDELCSVMTSVLNHVSVLLPAGPNPVMTGSEWGYPELEHDTPSCMKLLLEGISWSLSGFFGGGGSGEEKAAPAASSL